MIPLKKKKEKKKKKKKNNNNGICHLIYFTISTSCKAKV